jgi:hypothetical protein
MPIFHVLGLLSDMGDRYWVLPERTIGGHVAGGFASRDPNGFVRVLLFTHAAQDTQSRSGASFEVALDLAGLGWTGPASVQEYRFGRDHGSPFRSIKQILSSPRRGPGGVPPAAYTRADIEQVRRACQLQPTRSAYPHDADGHLRLKIRVDGNGCNVLTLGPDHGAR